VEAKYPEWSCYYIPPSSSAGDLACSSANGNSSNTIATFHRTLAEGLVRACDQPNASKGQDG
jgi:hypothetical protein